MKGFSKFFHNLELTFAITAVAFFAAWWFNPANIAHNFTGFSRMFDFVLFFLVSYIIMHPILMDILIWSLSSHIVEHTNKTPQEGLKVAFITTIVPASEAIHLLHKCLPAMIKASYAHDTWLLDEGGSDEVKAICDLYGVKYFSRFGKGEYNTRLGKFSKKTKGGNHNAWYDAYGKDYDIVAQIDTDFVPLESFLTDTLGFFRDPKVAFVGTPQIYGNTKDSFIALGASEQQYYFYGTVLRGLNGMETTLLIGANHIIRVAALKDVGLYSAHLTEDLLTGMKLHAKKWKSVYLPKALAVGDGPSTWESYFNQQMRWAYGCMDIFFNHSFKIFRQMGLRRSVYYFFLQQHYFSGIGMALSIVLLSLYFFAGLQAASVDLLRFAVFYSLILLICWITSVRLQRFNILSGEMSELQMAGRTISVAAWPIYFLAFINVIFGKRISYKVTPKGKKSEFTGRNLRLFTPHIIFGILALIGLISSFFTHRQNILMMFWACNCALFMLSVPFSQQFAQLFSSEKLQQLPLWRRIKTFFQDNPVNQSTNLSVVGQESFDIKPLKRLSQKSIHTSHRINSTLLDIFFICFTVIASAIPYIQKIGFYSDDWSFLANFQLTQNQTLVELLHTATTTNTFMRPVQNLYDVLLYMLFGINPLGYQVVNVVVLLGISLLFYRVLHQLRLPRIMTIVLPIVYILLPNFATDRFWFAAFQANMSMLLYFISLSSGLRSLSEKTTHSLIWKATSILTMILSILSYEVVIPLYIINMVLFWYTGEKNKEVLNKKTEQVIKKSAFIVLSLIVLIYTIIFKVMTTTRLDHGHDLSFYLEKIVTVTSSAFYVNFITLGFLLPHIWWNLINIVDTQSLIGAAIFGTVVFSYLLTVGLKNKSYFPSEKWLRNQIIAGIVLFICGYTIFFTNSNAGFSPTGVENRIAIAAGIGIALSIVGFIGYLCRLLFSEKLFVFIFCSIISIICTGGFLFITSLSSYWADAYKQEKVILSDIRDHNPVLQKHATIILDGVCRYNGPAPIFEANWDLKGALQIIYKDPTINADIVSPGLVITDGGLVTRIYSIKAEYPYKNLEIYNYKTKKSYRINDAQSARSYFQKYNPNYKTMCATEREGNGIDIL